ncbi:MAG: HAD hydrolase family protein [Trueperaceae bacterium]|nr:HAD hydrolase family protein [Trueperaceae bacterium]
MTRPVRAFICDLDGCIAAVGHVAFDLARLDQLARRNRESSDDPSIPPLSFVTGRPHSYVDAIMQALDVGLAVSFENGAGLATRHPYRAWLAPGIEEGLADVRRLERLVDDDPDMVLQPGKMASASVFPVEASLDPGPLMAKLRRMLDEHDLDLVLDPSNECVNVLIPGVDKTTGFEWLCTELGLEPADVAGIGDSVGDIGWLRRCGVSFAPANAAADVRASVTHALAGNDVVATVAAYEALVAANRAS